MGVLSAIVSPMRTEWLRRLGGPVLDKELRVSSRRGRNYLLRFGYLAALTIYVAVVWSADMDPPYDIVFTSGPPSSASAAAALTSRQLLIATRMADAGRAIVRDIVMFEFLVLPLLAVIMLSAAVREELNLRTLDVLMSTPTTEVQIIVGKIAGKMLQLVLMAAISLPLLAAVRVFGGVPWEYVVMAVATILITCLYFASVAAYMSLVYASPYVVIIGAYTVGWFTGLPGAMMACANESLNISAGSAFRASWIWWPVLAFFTCGASIIFIRKAAGRLGVTGSRRSADWVKEFLHRPQPPGAAKKPKQPGISWSIGHRTRVSDRPVLWRELHSRLIGNRLAGILAAPLTIGIVFVLTVVESGFASRNQCDFSAFCMGIGIVGTALLSSGGMAYEREAGTLTALLATPLTRW
jgi:ABC-type transport system involved in multi-copper enzyme maturation permease subunit